MAHRALPDELVAAEVLEAISLIRARASPPSFALSFPKSTSAWRANFTLALVSSRRSSPSSVSTTDLMSRTRPGASLAPSGILRSESLASIFTGGVVSAGAPGPLSAWAGGAGAVRVTRSAVEASAASTGPRRAGRAVVCGVMARLTRRG